MKTKPTKMMINYYASIGKACMIVAQSDELVEVGRKAVEETLVTFRRGRISEIRGNGLVIREEDGKASSVIRFGPEAAIRIALTAIARHLEPKPKRKK